MKRAVSLEEGIERVVKELVKLKEKYNRIIVDLAIQEYNETVVQKEIEADMEAMRYALNRGNKREEGEM